MQTHRIYLIAAIILILPGFVNTADAAVIRVNTIADVVNGADGLCSLREAITASDTNAASGAAVGECAAGSVAPVRDLIQFTVGGLITLDPVLGALPAVLDGHVMFNGWVAPGAGPGKRPKVGISCLLLGVGPAGLSISSGFNIVRGLVVIDCTTGIGINNPNGVTSNNHVYGNLIGLTPTGISAPNNNGIVINEGAVDNIVGTNGDGFRDRAERNVISGNTASGIVITSIGTSGNRIAGNIIGTNASGTAAIIPNQNYGITIAANTLDNIIGTNSDGNNDGIEGNLISGHNLSGILLAGGTGTIIAGNNIGTDAQGITAVPNHDGISIWETTTSTRVGTDGNGLSDTQERNIISGNNNHGIEIQGNQNVVSGNYIGLGLDGVTQIPNLWDGIKIYRGPALGGGLESVIGGPSAVFANYISANNVRGISQDGDLSTIQCNVIGSDIVGGNAANGIDGLMIEGDDHSITNNDILNHAFRGLYLVGVGLNYTIDSNNFEGNITGALSDIPGTVIIENNWWGDVTGPFHSTGNPGGLGDPVDEAVGATLDYDPWLAVASSGCI